MPPRPASPERYWDGFQWREVEVVPTSNDQTPRYLQTVKRGRIAEAEAETQELQRRLVHLQRQVATQRAQRARSEIQERRHEDAQAVRRHTDNLLGRDAIQAIMKVRAADEDDVREMSEMLNETVRKEYNLDFAQRSRAWIKLWREIDVDGLGRVACDAFTAMLSSKLRPYYKSRTARAELQRCLPAIWRSIDNDENGEAKGYLLFTDFLRFMKLGVPQRSMASGEGDEEVEAAAERVGWRQRMAERRRDEARALREERRARVEEDEMMADLSVWQLDMRGVKPASNVELRELSSTLNDRLGENGWYSLYKRMDRSGDGRISWREFASMVRERLRAISHADLRRAWRALDPNCSGFLSLPAFCAFMRLGSQQKLPPPTLHQLEAHRSRVGADVEHRHSEEMSVREQVGLRARLSDEADRLQLALARMQREGTDGDRAGRVKLPPAKTDRTHYKKILYREEGAERSYLGNPEVLEARRRAATYRRVNARVSGI